MRSAEARQRAAAQEELTNTQLACDIAETHRDTARLHNSGRDVLVHRLKRSQGVALHLDGSAVFALAANSARVALKHRDLTPLGQQSCEGSRPMQRKHAWREHGGA